MLCCSRTENGKIQARICRKIRFLCKNKDDVVAEYTLNDISQPIGIAEYELTKVLREEFKSSLPTVEEIENELSE